MGDVRINATSVQVPTEVNETESASASSAAPQTQAVPPQPQQSAETAGALKQQGKEVIGQNSMREMLLRQGLNASLDSAKPNFMITRAGDPEKPSAPARQMLTMDEYFKLRSAPITMYGTPANPAVGGRQKPVPDPKPQFAGPAGPQDGTATATKSANPDAGLEAAQKEAQALMDKGVKALNQGRYNEALEAFQEGFRTYPSPAFILNEASTLLDAGRYSEAVQAYERYLSDPDAPRADEARAAMERAKAAMGGREATITGVEESKNQYEKGAVAFQAGRYQEALDAFDRAYELNPLADFRYNQAACLEKLGRPYAAADRLQAYLDAKPHAKDMVEVTERMHKLQTAADKAPITATGVAGGQEWMSRGNRLLFAHRYDEAVKAFQEGFRTYPDSKFILNEAAAYLDGGRYAEADRAYDRYLSDPNAPRADEARAAQARARAHLGGGDDTVRDVQESRRLFDAGTAAYKEGRYEEALDAFEGAYERNPQPEFKYNQAACLERLGRRYAAADRYGQYLAERPNASDAKKVSSHIDKLRADADAAPITATGPAGGQEWNLRGIRLLNSKHYNEAAAAFQEGFRTYPDSKFILNEAAAYLDGGRYAEADLAYQRYLSDPNAPRADEARAAQARARSHMGGAEATSTGVAESQRLLEQGSDFYKAGKYHEALQAFDRAYALNPLADLRYNQAACLDKLGKRELAASRYEAYLAEKPDASDAAKVRTHITKLHADALQAAQSAFDRGQTAFNEGRYKEAAGAFAEAYEQKPFPQFLYNMAASYDKGGDTMRAVQDYQLYLNMMPDAPDADKVRRRIHTLLAASGNDLMQP